MASLQPYFHRAPSGPKCCCLTPRSRRRHTACKAGHAAPMLTLHRAAGFASRAGCLSSNVRQHKQGRAAHQQSQRLRREPDSHEGGRAANSRVGAVSLTAGRPTRVASAKPSYSTPCLWLSLHQINQEPPCQAHGPFFVGSVGLQSVPRAAVASSGAFGQGVLVRRPQSAARHARRRGAGSTCGRPPGEAGPWQGQRPRSSGAVLPNPSLKLSPNGEPPGPGRRYAVHFRQPGPGVPPSVPT